MQQQRTKEEEVRNEVLRTILLNLKNEDYCLSLRNNESGVVYEVFHVYWPGSSAKVTLAVIVPEANDPLTVFTCQAGWKTEEEVKEEIMITERALA